MLIYLWISRMGLTRELLIGQKDKSSSVRSDNRLLGTVLVSVFLVITFRVIRYIR